MEVSMSGQGAAPAVEPDLKIVQIACELAVDRSAVYRYIHDGFLRAYRLGDGRNRGPLRVKRTEVERFKAGRLILPEKGREPPLARSPGHHTALLRLAELGALTTRNER
jgi:excisionase family DNA binding protein